MNWSIKRMQASALMLGFASFALTVPVCMAAGFINTIAYENNTLLLDGDAAISQPELETWPGDSGENGTELFIISIPQANGNFDALQQTGNQILAEHPEVKRFLITPLTVEWGGKLSREEKEHPGIQIVLEVERRSLGRSGAGSNTGKPTLVAMGGGRWQLPLQATSTAKIATTIANESMANPPQAAKSWQPSDDDFSIEETAPLAKPASASPVASPSYPKPATPGRSTTAVYRREASPSPSSAVASHESQAEEDTASRILAEQLQQARAEEMQREINRLATELQKAVTQQETLKQENQRLQQLASKPTPAAAPTSSTGSPSTASSTDVPMLQSLKTAVVTLSNRLKTVEDTLLVEQKDHKGAEKPMGKPFVRLTLSTEALKKNTAESAVKDRPAPARREKPTATVESAARKPEETKAVSSVARTETVKKAANVSQPQQRPVSFQDAIIHLNPKQVATVSHSSSVKTLQHAKRTESESPRVVPPATEKLVLSHPPLLTENVQTSPPVAIPLAISSTTSEYAQHDKAAPIPHKATTQALPIEEAQAQMAYQPAELMPPLPVDSKQSVKKAVAEAISAQARLTDAQPGKTVSRPATTPVTKAPSVAQVEDSLQPLVPVTGRKPTRQEKEWRTKERQLLNVVRKHPKNEDAALSLANLYASQRYLTQSEQVITRFLRAKPDSAAGYYALTLIYLGQKRGLEAQASLATYQLLKPGDTHSIRRIQAAIQRVLNLSTSTDLISP